ncbi:MAG: hypothetical protein PGN13_03225 [Patulibacter minatonensis]
MTPIQSASQFSLTYEWEAPGAIRDEALAATWARLEITVDGEHITQVEDRGTGSSRRSVYTSLLPLAEWVAWNWWFLLGHRRGNRILGGASSARPGTSVWLRHNLRAAGDGMSWPNLVLAPEGSSTRLSWRADPSSSNRLVRFVGSGTCSVDTIVVEQALRGFVDSVTARLRECGINHTPLQDEWAAVRDTPSEERAFCLAAAALGLDPYDVTPGLATRIVEVAEVLSPEDAEQLYHGVSAEHLKAALSWIGSAVKGKERRPMSPRVVEARDIGLERVSASRPWTEGWEQARLLRRSWGLAATDRLDASQLFPVHVERAPDFALVGVGSSRTDGAMLVLGRESNETGIRFAQVRALWHAVARPPVDRFLITNATTDSAQIERAFAAEMLVPAEGLREVVSRVDDPNDDALIEEAAAHFGVSSRVVQHQIENQLLAVA